MSKGYRGLTPAQELELRQRREADAQQRHAARALMPIRQAYEEFKAARGDRLPTAEEVTAERNRRIVANEPHGVKELAKALHASSSTIRRRLGRL